MANISDLAQLRQGIDECDAQLVALLAKRNGITQKLVRSNSKQVRLYMHQSVKLNY